MKMIVKITNTIIKTGGFKMKTEPKSHIFISMLSACTNPLFGTIALIFSILEIYSMDINDKIKYHRVANIFTILSFVTILILLLIYAGILAIFSV